jgi:hypothetical protein
VAVAIDLGLQTIVLGVDWSNLLTVRAIVLMIVFGPFAL